MKSFTKFQVWFTAGIFMPFEWLSIKCLTLRGERPCRSPAEIVGSNPTGGMDICLLWVSCVVRYRSLRRADHSSRGVLPTVLRRYVWSRNFKNGCFIYIYIYVCVCVYIYIYIYIYDISRLRVKVMGRLLGMCALVQGYVWLFSEGCKQPNSRWN